MKKILIVGAGGCGREVLQWVKDCIAAEKEGNYPKSLAVYALYSQLGDDVEIKGFLDDNLEALDGVRCSHKVAGTISGYQPSKDEVLIMAIANSNIKEKVCNDLREKGARFANLVHPTAIVSETAVLGKGTIVYPQTILADNCIAGDFATINMHVMFGHDTRLGDYSTISPSCTIPGGVVIGKKVFLGCGVCVVPRISIEEEAFICAGSVVMRSVKAGRKMMGNPAQRFDF